MRGLKGLERIEEREALPWAAKAITWRSLLIGFGLIPINALWIVHTEVVRYAGHPTTMSLYFNVVFCLVILILLNAPLKRFRPRWALTPGELLVIYTVLSIGSCMVGHDLYQVLIATLVHPFRFATPENRWESLFFQYLPRFLMVSDKEVLKGYFEGHSTLYAPEHLRAWLRPVLYWTAFFGALFFATLCLNVLLRKQWAERERLAFPIIELPLAMSRQGTAFFRERLMWLGFGIAAVVDIINNLSANLPYVPAIPIRTYNLGQILVTRPWNAIGWTPIAFFPCIIGLAFLLPLDLSFSCWFFFWYWRLQRVLSSAMGWTQERPDMPYINDQSAGAFLGVAVFVLWIARGYFRHVVRRALGLSSEVSDAHEPLGYRWALLGVVGGFLFVVWFMRKAGMSLEVAIPGFLIYFALSLAVNRIRAEMGSPAHDLHFAGPDQMIPRVWGISNLNKQDLTLFALWWGFNRAYRSHPMPHQIEGFKLAEVVGYDARRLFWVMWVTVLFGSVVAFWALLHVYYDIGAYSGKMVGPATWFGWEPYNRLQSWLTAWPERDEFSTLFTVVGFLGCMFLMVMRTRVLNWPFHPVGYAVSSSWSMSWMWMAIFLAWLAKSFILRTWGLKGYRTALPFFLGLILGEFIVGSIANILGLVFGWQIYRFWG